MPDIAISTTAVDLSRLPAPEVIEALDYEAILAALMADLVARYPAFDALVESDPAHIVLQVAAYRELLLRQQFNDRVLQVFVAYSTGANLDQLGALFGVSRLVIAEATEDSPQLLETDDALRQRIVLAPESYSVAGPELGYVAHARQASGDVLHASATSPSPGEVIVAVLSRLGDGTASPELLAAVEARVNARSVRPLTDFVSVQSAEIIPFAISYQIWLFTGPDATLVLQEGRRRLDAYLEESRQLGRDITRSAILAALHVSGVQNVVLATPAADVVCTPLQAGHCTTISGTVAGISD
jgi:phage-related baseplate assembly protein